jgi:arylsulfatase A-like enzyme
MHSHRYENATCYPGHEDEATARKALAAYYGMISMMDHYIGRILDHLEDAGLAADTLVVFTSDHGHFYGQHGLVAKGPFHYEDLIRVPLLARVPGGSNPGTESSALVTLVDLAPTLLEWAGQPVPERMSGVSQLPVLQGEAESVRSHVIVENRHEPTTIHLRTYVDQRYKLTVYYNHEYGELFDLEKDPNELHNRWSDPDYRLIKEKLLLGFLQAEMAKAPPYMPRISGA